METNSPQPDLDSLERDIRRLQIEFARFFAGDRERPPNDLQDELAERVRRFRTAPQATTVQRFRLNSLAARLSTLNELFDRRMRQHSARRHSRVNPTDAVVAGSERGSSAVRRLYLELYKKEEQPASLTGFRDFLEKKVSEIRGRTGCSSVQFRVIDNDGKRTLKARALGRDPKTKQDRPKQRSGRGLDETDMGAKHLDGPDDR